MIKNYGLKFSDTPDISAYVLGGLIELPKIILQPNRNWSPYLPKYEVQYNKNFDSYGCTVFGTENCIETYIKRLRGEDGIDYNYSERFIYNIANVVPPGADPHEIAECIRNNGLIDQTCLPFTETYAEFIQPRPMEAKYLVKGQQWPYILKHEYVWNVPQTREQRIAKVKEYLQYSPLGISVTAWFEKNGVYVDNGLPNTHWVICYGMSDRGFLVFDSYENSHKIVSYNHNIQVCKRYLLLDKEITRNWLIDILKNLLVILKDILKRTK